MHKSMFVAIPILFSLSLAGLALGQIPVIEGQSVAQTTELADELGANRVIHFKHARFVDPFDQTPELDPREREIGDVVLSRFLLSHLNPVVRRDTVADFETGKVEVIYMIGGAPGAFVQPMLKSEKPRFVFDLTFLVYSAEHRPEAVYRLLSHEVQHYVDYKAGVLAPLPVTPAMFQSNPSAMQSFPPAPPYTLATAQKHFVTELRAYKTEHEDAVKYGWMWSGKHWYEYDPVYKFRGRGLDSVMDRAISYCSHQKFNPYVGDLQLTAEQWFSENCPTD